MTFTAPPESPNVVWWHRAQLERWIDADTAVVSLDRAFNTYRIGMRVRLAKIDAPERFTDEGKAATAFVRSLVPDGAEVMIYSHKDRTGKYGRLLGEIVYEGQNINQVLVEQGHARYE